MEKESNKFSFILLHIKIHYDHKLLKQKYIIAKALTQSLSISRY